MPFSKISLARLDEVHPELARRIKQLDQFVPLLNIQVVQGLRTYEQQDLLYAQGRTVPGKIVTNVKGGYSAHNFGYACFDKKTEVLTKEWGWLPFTMIGNSHLAAFDGKNLVFEKPIGYTAYRYTGKMTKVTTRSCDLLMTKNHKCIVGTSKSPEWTTCEAKNLYNIHRIPVAAPWMGEEIKAWPFIGEVSSLDWWSFMGWYLSEGWSIGTSSGARKTGNHRNRVGISQQYTSSCFEDIKLLAERMPFFSRYDGRAFIFDCKSLWDVTFPLGHSLTKRIPRYLFDAPIDHLRALWDSLFLGDGSHGPGNVRFYWTSSQGLASDVSELLTRLGIANITSTRPKRKNCATAYCVISRSRTFHELRNGDGRECVRQDQGYDDMVYCAKVPSGSLFVRRNGKVCISGNCDLVPEDIQPGQPDWNLDHPAWKEMLAKGPSVGLAEGARWRTFPDNPHFYLQELPADPTNAMRAWYLNGGIDSVWAGFSPALPGFTRNRTEITA